MHRFTSVLVLGLTVSFGGLPATAQADTSGAIANQQGETLQLAEASSKTRRGRRSKQASSATAEATTTRRSTTHARRKDRKSAQTASAGTAPTTDRVVSRRGNRGATHAGTSMPVPTHLERFLAGVFAPTSPWETPMVLVTSERTGNHVWVAGIEPGPEGTFKGVIAKDARIGQGDAPEQPVVFARQQIRDWGFVEEGRGYGFVTLRQDEDTEAGTVMVSMLAPSAFPADW